MKITKQNNNLVLTIPLWQKSYDAVDQYIGKVPNLIGVAGKEFSISWLIDLGYKGVQQEGMPVIMFNDKEELETACKDLGLDIWEHSICDYCHNTIYGSFTLGKKGIMCFSCELKEKKK